MIPQIGKINWTQTFLNFTENPLPLIIFGALWWAWWLYSIWDCLTRLKDPQRLTWLVVIIGVPLFGVFFYWFKGSDEAALKRDLI